MASVLRDVWPKDIEAGSTISPERILKEQGKFLETRTKGLLTADIVSQTLSDRVAIRFEVGNQEGRKVNLFTVSHRLEAPYPAVFKTPIEEAPSFLKSRQYNKSNTEAMLELAGQGKWVENPWLAGSATEFTDLLEEVLGDPLIRSLVTSLLPEEGGEGETDANEMSPNGE